MVSGLVGRLRKRGWPMTAQRRVIAEILAGEHVHLSAEEIFQRAVARLPEISRATVYNTLKKLTELGELLEVSSDERAKRYDPNASDPHHHLICQRCGLIRDVHPNGQGNLSLPSGERYGFQVTGVEIMFHGLCPSCARSRDPAAASPRGSGPRRSSARLRSRK
jgi:Fe2+ or Zn2+ uptake regulation protein